MTIRKHLNQGRLSRAEEKAQLLLELCLAGQ